MHETCRGGLFHKNVYQDTILRSIEKICKLIGPQVPQNPICVETGMVFQYEQTALQHHTTNNLTKFVCEPKDGILYGLDIDPQMEIISKILRDTQVDVKFLKVFKCDSVVGIKKVIKLVNQIDVLCLDSNEDPDHTMAEFETAFPKLAKKHFILVDDIHNPNSNKYKKIVVHLKQLGYEWRQVPTPTGMLIATKGYLLY